MSELRRALDERFARAAGGRDGLALPPLLRETMVEAAARTGALPEAVARYYCDEMPRLRSRQLDEPLLNVPLDFARTSRLASALDGLWAELARSGHEPAHFTGANSPAALARARPTPAALYAPTLFASGVPMVGAWPHDCARLQAACASESREAVLDRALAGHLVHELCHGPARAAEGPPAPWLVLEAAALTLGASAWRAHVFPDEPGEAVPGVSRFVLVGEALAARGGASGRHALYALLIGRPLAELVGQGAAAPLEAAAWQEFASRGEPPFARDATRALDFIKLLEAARAERVHAGEPDLFARARSLAWSELPWWHEAAGPGERALVERGMDALCTVNRLAPSYQTAPSEPPGGKLTIDVAACRLFAEARPDGVFGEPAEWLWPPPLARALHERGCRLVRVEGVTRRERYAWGAALLRLAEAAGPLPSETVLRSQA